MVKWIVRGRKLDNINSIIKKKDGSITTTLVETVNTILDEFIPTSVEDKPITLCSLQDNESEVVANYGISKEDLKNIIWMQKSSAPGADGITIRILKAIWSSIADSLTLLMIYCMMKDVFPYVWKETTITVIRKSEDKDPLLPKSFACCLCWVRY